MEQAIALKHLPLPCTGTRLEIVKQNRQGDLRRWTPEFVCGRVETEQGERGWVAINLQAVGYAD